MTALTNRHGIPAALVRALENDPYDPGECDITVTRLIRPPQLQALHEAHAGELVEDASDRVWALLGQGIHAVLERSAEPGALVEHRLFAQAAGWTISGAVDRMAPPPHAPGHVEIEDIKTTTVYGASQGLKPEWRDQLRALQWLAEENGHRVSGLSVIAVLRDWSRSRAQRDRAYPQGPVVTFGVRPFGPMDLAPWVVERVRAQQEARKALAEGRPLPPCTDADRWTSERGEPVRCLSYCPVRMVCQQSPHRPAPVADPGGARTGPQPRRRPVRVRAYF